MTYFKRYDLKDRRCTTLFLEKFVFRDQYGFIKDPRLEKIDDFTAVNAISSSDNDQSDSELDHINTDLSEMLRGLELRKRAYYVNMPHLVYVIGGYLFDPIRKERRAPPNDWRWDLEEKKLEKIPPIPGHGRINFGLAANNSKVVVLGGNNILNKPTESCYVYGQNDDQWEPLPSLPNPLCGSEKDEEDFVVLSKYVSGPAVALDDKDSLFVFGGYDLLSGQVMFRNDFFQLKDLTSNKWIPLKNTLKKKDKFEDVLPRARALLVACSDDVIAPDGGLFACGGYHKSPSGELVPVPEILCFDKAAKEWTLLAEIPNLKKLNIFAVENNVLIISEKMKSEDPNEDDQLVPVSKYDLVQRKWLLMDGKDMSEAQEKT